MSNAVQTSASTTTHRAPMSRRSASGGIVLNVLFALAFGFAAAVVLGLVP